MATIDKRLENLEKLLKKGEEVSPEQLEEMRERLIDKLSRLEYDEEKIKNRKIDPWTEQEIKDFKNVDNLNNPRYSIDLKLKNIVLPLNKSEKN